MIVQDYVCWFKVCASIGTTQKLLRTRIGCYTKLEMSEGKHKLTGQTQNVRNKISLQGNNNIIVLIKEFNFPPYNVNLSGDFAYGQQTIYT